MFGVMPVTDTVKIIGFVGGGGGVGTEQQFINRPIRELS